MVALASWVVGCDDAAIAHRCQTCIERIELNNDIRHLVDVLAFKQVFASKDPLHERVATVRITYLA